MTAVDTATATAHPYAEAWPMLAEDELRDLAEDIAANGLRNPVVVFGGLILDGRNRNAACALVDVEPATVEFEGTDDEALAFVQSINGARRHQSKGSLAASWALSMLAAGKRSDGRWAYGESNDRKDSLNYKDRAQVGLIADEDAALLVQVRDEALSLNAAHEQAKSLKSERLAVEERERIAAQAEAKAERFLRDSAPDLAELVGTTYETFLEAEAVWKIRHAEEAKAIADAERAAREAEVAIEQGIRDALRHMSNAIQFPASLDAEMWIESTLVHRSRYLDRSTYLTAEHIDAAIDFLTAIRKAL